MSAALIEGRTGSWEIIIGLEVHAQVISEAKLFSGASAEFGAEPNSQVSPVDAGFPGMLPVINQRCVEQAIRTGIGLNAEINEVSVFDRKNYFYADLPQGYQISQFTQPIVGKGSMVLDLPDGTTKTVGVTRLHLEQDAGKSLHDQSIRPVTYVDLNRSGIVPDGDRHGARTCGLPKRPRAFPEKIARHRALSGHLRRQYGRRLDALPTCNVSVRRVYEARYACAAGDALRDQKRQLDALCSARR